jgi:predicted transposase YbfD/YdcC
MKSKAKAIVGNEPDFLEDIETLKPYNGHSYGVRDVLLACFLGSICGLRNILMIWKWAVSHHVELMEQYNVIVPQRSHFYLLLSLIDSKSLNTKFARWMSNQLGDLSGLTVSFDGKTVRSTEKMDKFERPLHIVSAFVAELGLTIGSHSVGDKTNEIPTMRELLKMLQLKGAMVVADALHCQTETAKAIIESGADYLLDAKDNQPTLKSEIEDYVQDNELRAKMDTEKTKEQNGGRIESRTAYATQDVQWMSQKANWPDLASIGAIKTQVHVKGKVSEEWHYYISSSPLTAKELLYYARAEWSIENSLHWRLDVIFNEDHILSNNKNILLNLNIIRKAALNRVTTYRNSFLSRESVSGLMANCLFHFNLISNVTGIGLSE